MPRYLSFLFDIYFILPIGSSGGVTIYNSTSFSTLEKGLIPRSQRAVNYIRQAQAYLNTEDIRNPDSRIYLVIRHP